MRTRRQILIACSALLALPLAATLAQPDKVKRVGFIGLQKRPEPLASHFYGVLASALKELGWVEGKNLVIEWRFADGQYERVPGIVAELLRIPVDVLVTEGTPGTQAAQKATRSVPIVFSTAGDPLGNGLVQSLARPGGNTTGISLVVGGANESAKQIEMLKLIVPRLARVAVLVNPDNPYSSVTLKSLEAAIQAAGVATVPFQVRTPADIDRAFDSMRSEQTDGLVMIADGFITQQRGQIAQLALKNRLPTMGGVREFVEAGGLMSYGQNRRENYRRAAEYVDKILRGANPGELPVQQPMTLELVINKKTAKALGLEIPAELLVLADRVIE